jgi:hypothetical protein
VEYCVKLRQMVSAHYGGEKALEGIGISSNSARAYAAALIALASAIRIDIELLKEPIELGDLVMEMTPWQK